MKPFLKGSWVVRAAHGGEVMESREMLSFIWRSQNPSMGQRVTGATSLLQHRSVSRQLWNIPRMGFMRHFVEVTHTDGRIFF